MHFQNFRNALLVTSGKRKRFGESGLRGSKLFSDFYQSRTDRPAACQKTKSSCTPAICKSSLWYTCYAYAPAKTHKHGSADTHGCTNIHTHPHTSSLFQGSFVKMTAGLLLRRSLPGRIPRLLSGSQNILGNILTHRGCRAIVYASLSLHACMCKCATFPNAQQHHCKVQPLFSFCLCLAGADLAGNSTFCQASSQHQKCILLPPLPEHLSSFAFLLTAVYLFTL